jgi:broad specificity phosphatase PhoE
MADKITNIELNEFLKDHLERAEIILLEEGKEQDDILSVAKAKGYILKGSNDLAGFKTIFTFANKANINKARLPKELLLKALPGIIGKPMDIDHNRIYVVGHYIDYKYVAAKEMVIAYGVFYKSNFGEEWAKAKELFKAGKLSTSYEIWCPKNKRKYFADGTYALMSMEIAGGGLMFKEKPAFPDAKVEALENASVQDFIENVKKNITEHSEELIFASVQKKYDTSEIIMSGMKLDSTVVDTKMCTSDELIGTPVSTALPAGDKVELCDKRQPIDLVKVAQDNALKNTGVTPQILQKDKLADNTTAPAPALITTSCVCANCKKEFTTCSQTFQRKNSMDYNEVAADAMHKCPSCSAIVNKADGSVKYPPQLIDFNLNCPACSSRNWRVLKNSPETADVKCMQCSKNFKLDFAKKIDNPLLNKITFMSEGTSSCPQCGNRIPYSTSSKVDSKNVTCPKCDLHFDINLRKASDNKRTINRANEFIEQEENQQIGDGGGQVNISKASVEVPEEAKKDETMKNQPVKIRQNQDITDVMAGIKQNKDSDNTGALYLVRHGKTSLNNDGKPTDDKIRGWKDVPLDKEGRLEAKELGQIFKGKKIDKLYSSDLNRASETAEEISKATGTPVTKKFDLRPWNLGKHQGVSSSKVGPAIADAVSKTPHIKVEGGESFNNFKTRALGMARKLIEEAKQKKVVAVTHTRDLKLIQAWIKAGCQDDNSIDPKEFMTDSVKTGSIHKIVSTDKGVKLTEVENLNRASILDNDTTVSSDEGGIKKMEEIKNETPETAITVQPVAEVVTPVPATDAPVASATPAPVVDEVEDMIIADVDDAEAIEAEELLEVSKTLKAEDRNALSNQKFAVVKKVKGKDGKEITVRKYPIHDKAHVANALARLHQDPSREGLKKLGVDPDAVITKVKAAGKKMGMEEAEIEGYCVASKGTDMQEVVKRGKDDVQEASVEESKIKTVKTGDDSVEGLTPDQLNQMQNQLFANVKQAMKFRKFHKASMKNIKALKKAMAEGCFASVEPKFSEAAIANMEIKGTKTTPVSDVGTGEKPTEAVTTGTKDVPVADPIVVENTADEAAKELADNLVPKKIGESTTPILPVAAPVENAEVPVVEKTAPVTVSDGVAEKVDAPVTVGEAAGSKTDVLLDVNADANALAAKLIPEVIGDALKPGSELKPIEAPAAEVVNTAVVGKGEVTPVDTVSDGKVAVRKGEGSDTEILKSSVDTLQIENEALKAKIHDLESAAIKVAERKNVLGEYGKDLSDKDILDDGKFEVARKNAEQAKRKLELNKSSVNVAEVVSTLDVDALKSLKAEITAKASKMYGK